LFALREASEVAVVDGVVAVEVVVTLLPASLLILKSFLILPPFS
jgi:hypothetical protein